MIEGEYVELSRRIATEVMGEPEPPPPPEDTIVGLGFGDGVVSSGHVSEGGNWRAVRIWEHGDVPEWRPIPFSTNFSRAMLAVEHYVENIDFSKKSYDDAGALILSRAFCDRDRPPCGAFLLGGEGFGQDMPEAICRLLLSMEEEKT